jgi:hypothetical protein
MAVMTGRREEALSAFEQALAVETRLGARTFATHSRVGLAELSPSRTPLARAGSPRTRPPSARPWACPDPSRVPSACSHASAPPTSPP